MRAEIAATDLAECKALLVGLCLQAYAQLRAAKKAGKPFPKLYESGVRYQREPRGRDSWRTPSQVLRDGIGDCEDLVAWRVAELWLDGERTARPDLKQVRPGLKHAFARVRGVAIDPSRKLGMKPRVRKG